MRPAEAISVVYEDEVLLAIDKPAGLSSESGAATHPSAEAWAAEHVQRHSRRRRVYVRAVHRLDRVSSGVLLLAKSKSGLQHLMEQFAARTVRKVYLAEVVGEWPEVEGELVHYLTRSADGRTACASDKPAAGWQVAQCAYRRVAVASGKTRLMLYPSTGRFHQLRAQLAYVGFPIIGDVLYGGPPWKANAIRLHALELWIKHPVHGHLLCLSAPPPAEWSRP